MTKLPILHGVPEGHDAFVLRGRSIAAQRTDGAVACHIAMDDARAQTLIDLMAFFAPDIEVIYFPAWDCLPYDRVSPNTQIIGERMRALSDLNARESSDIKKPCLVITTVNAVLRKTVAPIDLSTLGGISIAVGQSLKEESLRQFLSANGYEQTDIVRESGEYDIRGGIIDLWQACNEVPIR